MCIFWSCACFVKRKPRQNWAERQRRQHLTSLELQRNEMRKKAVAYFIAQQSASSRAQISQKVDRKKLIENSLCVAEVENEEEALNNDSVKEDGNVFSRAWMNTLDAARSFTRSKPECSICLSGYEQEKKWLGRNHTSVSIMYFKKSASNYGWKSITTARFP